MNIRKKQQPYVFHPPSYSPLLAPFLGKTTELLMLRGKFNVRQVGIEGADRIAALVKEGHSILVAPNHADHADPFVLDYAGRRWGLPFHYMAAREGFEQNRLIAFALRRSGVFSIDREGADIAAIKTAMKLLQECVYPLIIFPEGEIYHHHERLAPLNEGVATIRLRASENLPHGKRAYIVPTAVRYFYHDDVAATFAPRLDALEERITWKPRPDLGTVERIYRLGSGLLGLKEVEFFGESRPGALVERILNLQTRLIERVEAKHGGPPKDKTIPERVKSLRGKIRKKLFEEAGPPAERNAAALHDDLDTLFLAVQLYSYPGQYLRERPSVHRIAETLLKLEEDVMGSSNYATVRRARVRFGEPIDIHQFLQARSLTAKTAAEPLTEHLAQTIQSMIDAMDADPGGV